MRKGGYGLSSYGRSEFGHGRSVVEPRFSFSVPANHSSNVSRDQFLKFTTYCFSSWLDLSDLVVEISENTGITFNPVYNSGVFVSPYNGTNSHIFRSNSQQLDIIIEKIGLWPIGKRVYVKFTGTDEFGQPATILTPEYWVMP